MEMKMEFRVVIFLCLSLTAMVLGGGVAKCFTCKEFHAKECHSPVANLSVLDKQACGEDDVISIYNFSTRGPSTEAAPPPDAGRLVEFRGAASTDFKCVTIVGRDNVTKMKTTYRGCHVGGCDRYHITSIIGGKCADCAEDLCNSSIRFHPAALGLLIGLWIPIGRLVLEWSKFRV